MISWIRRRLLALNMVLTTGLVFGCAPAVAQASNGFSTGFNLPLGLQIDGGGAPILYAALKGGGVLIYDITDPLVPRAGARIVRAALGGMDAMNLHQDGTRLYVALGDHFRAGGAHAGLAVIDVSDPRSPQVLGVWKSPKRVKGAGDVVVNGNTAWLGIMSSGVVGLDVSNPGTIKEVSRFLPDRNFPKRNPGRLQIPAARGLFIDGDLLFIANDAGGLHVLDISDPAAPRITGRYINPNMGRKPSAYNNILVRDGLAYAAIDYCGLEVIDVRNPREMQQIGWWNPWSCQGPANTWFNSGGHTNQLAWDGPDRLALSAGDSELVLIDVSDPRAPRQVGGIGASKNGLGVWSIARTKDYSFLGYIRTPIPFSGRWSGIRAVPLN